MSIAMPEPSPVRRIGRFEIQAELGRGGFGRVYRAYDPTVGRLVAIKILTAEGSDLLSRFRNEAAAAGNLHHRNIVTIYEYGDHEGVPYIAMEFLEGEDLSQLLSGRAPLSLLEKVSIMLQVAEGLACAHNKGVVHRDVKPANIRLLPDGTVKIMDFGIARLTGLGAGPRLTHQGDLIGTLLYMSPEQIMGADVDTLSDVFAYGVTFYELLTGRHPFQAPDPRAVLFKITTQDPEPVRTYAPDCPEALDQVIRRALQRDRELRYQNLKELQFDIEPILMELQQERAASLFTEAREKFTEEDIEQTQALLLRVLELDPSHRPARELRAQLHARLQKRMLRPKIEELAAKGAACFAERRFNEACEHFQSALRLDPDSAELHGRLEEARGWVERARNAAKLILEARQILKQEPEAALAKVSQASELDPFSTEARRLVETISRQLEARERAERFQAAVARARELLKRESFEEAAAALAGLEPELREAPDALALAADLEARRADFDRRERLRAELTAAVRDINGARFGAAIERLRALAKDFPGEQEPAELLAAAEKGLREQALTELADGARLALSRGDLEGAFASLEDGLKSYPGEERLAKLKAEVAGEAVKRTKAEAEALLAEGRPAEAAAAIRAAGSRYSVDAALGGVLARVMKAQAIQETIARARRHLDQGEFEHGLRLIGGALREYPGERELAELEAEIAVAQASARAESFLRESRYDDALATIAAAGERHGASPALAGLADQVRNEAVLAAVARAESLVRAGRVENAIGELQSAASRYGPHAVLSESLVRSEQELLRRRREAARKDTLNRAETLRRNGAYGEALRVLEAASGEYGQDAEVVALAQLVRGERDARERREAVQSAVSAAQSLLESGRAREAAGALEAAAARYPGEPDLQEALSRSYLRSGDFDRALEAIREHGPDAPAFEGLRQEIAAAKAEWERERGVERALAEAEALRRSGDFEKALDSVRKSQAQYGDAPVLAGLAGRLQKEWDARQREEAVAQVRLLADARKYDEAAAAVERALRRWQNDSELRAQRTQIAASRAREMSERGDYDGGRAVIAAAQSQYGEDAALSRIADELASKAAAAQVRTLVEARQYETALAAVEDALGKWPDEAAFRALRAQIAAAQEALREATGRAQALLRNSEFSEALAVIAAAQSQYGEDAALSRLADEVAAKSAAAHVRTLVEARQYEEALAAVEDALRKWPDEAGFRALRAQIAAAEEARREAEGRAQALLQSSEFNEALDVIAAAQAQYGEDAALSRLADEVAAKSAAAHVRALVEARQYEEALAAVGDAQRNWPDEAGFRALRAQIAAARGAQEFLENSRFSEALDVIAAARAQYGEDAALSRLADEVAAKSAAAQVRLLVQGRKFEEAVAAVEDALRKWPDEAGFRALRTETAAAHAQALLQNNGFSEASDVIAAAQSRYGADPALTLLADEVAAKSAAAQVRLLVQGRKFEEAVAAVEDALGKWPDDAGFRALRTETAAAHAQALLQNNGFSEASDVIAAAQSRYGADPALTLLADEVAAKSAAAQVRLLVQGRKFEEAVAAVEDALRKWPDDAGFRALRTETAAAHAQTLLQNNGFSEASDVIAAAQSRYGADPALSRLADEVAAKSAVGRIRALVGERQFDEALAALGDALRRWPHSADLDAVRHEITLGRARELSLHGDFEGALAIVAAAQAQYGEDPALSRLADEVAAKSAAARVHSLVGERKYEEALTAVEDALRKWPEEAGLRASREQVAAVLEGRRAAESRARALSERGEYGKALELIAVEQARHGAEPALALLAEQVAVRALISARKFDDALAAADAALRHWPGDTTLLALRGQIAEAEAARRDALSRAEDLGRKGQFEAALQVIAAVLQQHGDDPALGALAARFREEWNLRQRSEAARAATAEALALLARGQHNRAVALLESAAAQYPGEAEVARALERALAESAQAARKQAQSRAQALLEQGEFEQALAILRAAMAEHGDDGSLAALSAAITAQWDVRKRTAAASEALTEASFLVDRGQLDRAIAVLEAAAARYPEEAELTRRLADLRIEREAGEPRALVAAKDFDRASAVVETALRAWPDAPPLAALRQEIAAAQTARNEARTRAEALLQNRQFEQAMEVARQAQAQYGREPLLAALEARIRSDWDAWKESEEVRVILTGARALLESGQYERAAATLEPAAARHPAFPEVARELERARTLCREKEREAAVARVLREIRELLEAGETKRARAAVAAALLTFPEEPALEALKREIKQARSTPQPAKARRLKVQLAAAGLGVIALAGAVAFFRMGSGTAATPVEIRTVPPGALVRVDGRTCTTPDCKLELKPGTYAFEAILPGYKTAKHSLDVRKQGAAPVAVTLDPLPPALRIATNLDAGSVRLDGRPAGELQGGQFLREGLAPGKHELELSARDAGLKLNFESDVARLPVLTRVPQVAEGEAVVVTAFNGQAVISCPGCTGEALLDGKPAGDFRSGELRPQPLSQGDHELEVKRGSEARKVPFHIGVQPSITVSLISGKNVGTLLVETGVDGATLVVNGRRRPGRTTRGQLALPLEPNDYDVRVELPGYRSEPASVRARVNRGDQIRVAFKLHPLAAALVLAGTPGATVTIDGKPAGAIGTDGKFSTSVQPGERRIEISKDGYQRAAIGRAFAAGQTVEIGGPEAQLAEIPPPPKPQAAKPVVKAEPPPPPRPDPAAVEAQAYEKAAGGTAADLEAFLKQHPDTRFSRQAAAKIEELDWAAADKSSRGALEAFLRKHQAGAFAGQARNELQKLERQESAKAETGAVLDALNQYVAAYNARDLDALTLIMRGFSSDALRQIRESFRQFREVRLQLVPEQPSITGDTATVRCARSLTVSDSTGRRRVVNDNPSFKLAKSGGRWYLTGLF